MKALTASHPVGGGDDARISGRPVDISVIICTRNRAADLPDALASVWAQEPALDTGYELIVVDNGSSDGTRELLQTTIENAPISTRYIYEPIPGLSRARNAGAEAAMGKIFAYLDDDAIASPGWLNAIWRSFQQNENVWVVGGCVKLKWMGERPAWLDSQLESALSSMDLGDRARKFGDGEYPFGVNFSCRKSAWREVQGFCDQFTLYNDERYFCLKVRERGREIFYAPGALVWHKVNAYRLRRRYFLWRSYLQGQADYRFAAQERIEGGRLKLIAFRVKSFVMSTLGRLIASPACFFRLSFWLGASYDAGIMTGPLSDYRDPRKEPRPT
jgi:glycosyltransferase involved in cell wall biosynthesis